MFYDNFINLCTQKDVTPSAVMRAIGLNKSSATYWKKGSIPSSETLQKLADYFGVSVDYLLNGTIEITSAYIGPGIAIYRNTSPYGINLSVLEDVPEGSYDIKYQDKHTIVTVDKDSPLSEIAQTDLINEILLAYNLHSSAVIEESLTEKESAIKTLLNDLGYDIIKQHGNLVFSYGNEFSVISDSDFRELSSCAKNGLKVAAKTLELKLLQEAFGPRYRREEAPEPGTPTPDTPRKETPTEDA